MTDKPVALVTGASRGLGAAIAREFANAGYFTWVHYRLKEQRAREVLDLIVAGGGEGALTRFDLRDPKSVTVEIDRIAGAGKRIDVLVNNAGVLSDSLFPLMKDEQWTEIVETNVNGCFRCTRAVVPVMIRAGKGSIVTIASVAGLRGSPGQANYAASKGAVIAFTRTLAVELAPRGIRVNAVLPGLIDAGMTKRMNREILQRNMAAVPMGRLGDPGEVARAVLFLASGTAGYITGQILAVDGGLSA